MRDFVRSDLFALITGLASVIGTLLAIYQIRVNKTRHSSFRRREWQKALMISVGAGLVAASGVKFYFQDLPPSVIPLRQFYDTLHGISASQWPNGVYSYSGVGADGKDCYFELVRIEVNKDRTQVMFNVKPHVSIENVTQCDQIREPQIKTSFGEQFSSLNRQFVIIDKRNAQLNLTFPSITGGHGELMIWASPVTDTNQRPLMLLDNDFRQSGTSLWGLLVILGFAIAVLGLTYNPFNAYKRKLIEEGKKLHSDHMAELKKILGKKQYDDLTALEKQHYDRTDEFYRRTNEVLLRNLSEESAPESNEH